jgi:hypothetical protein
MCCFVNGQNNRAIYPRKLQVTYEGTLDIEENISVIDGDDERLQVADARLLHQRAEIVEVFGPRSG